MRRTRNCQKFSGIALACTAALLMLGCKTDKMESAVAAVDTSVGSNASAIACVDGAILKLGIDMKMAIKPALLADILHNSMYIDDLPSAKNLVTPKLNDQQAFTAMLQSIRSGIIEKQPAMVEFLCAAVDENLFPPMDANAKAVVERTIHHTYLLDILTKEMFDNWQFMDDVRAHFLKKRKEFGIDSNFLQSSKEILQISGGLFFTAKTKTMDWVFENYQRIRSTDSFVATDEKPRRNGLILNILEAVIADKQKGNQNNSLTGVALAINPPKVITLEGENRYIKYDLTQEWASIYETWNLAFITLNMNNLQLLYPKLLAPQVLNATGEKYVFNRALALWASINFHLLSLADKKPEMIMPMARPLAERWGQINIKYAKDYVRRVDKKELVGYSNLLALPHDAIKNSIAKILGWPLDE